MSRTIRVCTCAALLAAAPVAPAQEKAAASPQEAPKTPGRRLRVQFQETRLRGESTTATRSYALALHADGGPARAFVGPQVAITVAGQAAATTLFKNVGVECRAEVGTLGDGRYRLDVTFDESSVLAQDGKAAEAGGNPILRVVRGESRLTLREGETIPFASAVDPVSGEVVRVDLTLTAPPPPRPSPAVGRDGGRLRARLVLTRRQGESSVVRRPYSVVLQAGSEEGARVFSGSMLPVMAKIQGDATIALKDVGAGLRIKARRAEDGRYVLNVDFSDGTLAPGEGGPQVRTFQSESQLVVQGGEAVTVASAVDPRTGEVVEAELTIEAVP